jgi:glycosyltransferase involved in cell wall biosynthesis
VNITVCPLSPALLRDPELITGATTHIIGFVNAMALQPNARVKLLYPRGAETGGFERNVEIVTVDVPPRLKKRSNRFLQALFWNLFVFVLCARYLMTSRRTRESPDVLYVRYSPSVVLPIVLLKLFLPSTLLFFEINMLASISAANYNQVIRWTSRRVDALSISVCDQAFVVSEDLRLIVLEEHGQRSARKIRVNPNGVDPKRFKPMGHSEDVTTFRESMGFTGDNCIVGYAGKALPHHRLDMLAEVVVNIPQSQLKLVIAGNLDSISRHTLQQFGEDRVILLGQIAFDQMPLFLNACDILVLAHGPSYNRYLHQSPMKLFEYMAVGKPIVASRIGQIEQVLSPGKNALLFQPDNPDELAKCLITLEKDTALGERLGQASRETVMGAYTWHHNAARVLQAALELKPNLDETG